MSRDLAWDRLSLESSKWLRTDQQFGEPVSIVKNSTHKAAGSSKDRQHNSFMVSSMFYVRRVDSVSEKFSKGEK